MTQNIKQNHEEFKELFYKGLYNYWDEKGFKNQFKYIVKLNDNSYLYLDNPSIKTSFCFADDYDDYENPENPNNSYNRAHNARTNQNYFISKNLEKIEEKINQLKDTRNLFVLVAYDEWPQHVCYRGVDWYGTKDNPTLYNWYGNYKRILTDEDIENILEVLEQIKKDFTKRLQTYLKRYGLSKVHAWTYWGNE